MIQGIVKFKRHPTKNHFSRFKEMCLLFNQCLPLANPLSNLSGSPTQKKRIMISDQPILVAGKIKGSKQFLLLNFAKHQSANSKLCKNTQEKQLVGGVLNGQIMSPMNSFFLLDAESCPKAQPLNDRARR